MSVFKHFHQNTLQNKLWNQRRLQFYAEILNGFLHCHTVLSGLAVAIMKLIFEKKKPCDNV